MPRSDVGVIVALADKLETLVGLFGIGQLPTGDKDPFALRRHALGVLKLMMHYKYPASLEQIVIVAMTPFVGKADVRESLLPFMLDRFRGMMLEAGYGPLEIEAVISSSNAVYSSPALSAPLYKAIENLAAVRAFAKLPEALNLADANKRINNILNKADGYPTAANPTLFELDAEKDLYAQMQKAKTEFDRYAAKGDLTNALVSLAQLKSPVDKFFKDVMVNVEDQHIRSNRLGLLEELYLLMNQVADLSKLAA